MNKDEQALIKRLAKRLKNKTPANQENYRHYYQKAIVPFLGVHDTHKQRALSFCLGWGSQPVDMLNERINFLNFFSPKGGEWLDVANNVFNANDFAMIENALQRDAGTVGTTYSSVWYGDKEQLEPEIFITAESPISTIGELNPRNGLVEVALQIGQIDGEWVATLYTKNEIIKAIKSNKNSEWSEIEGERIEHGLNQVPIFQVINNADTLYPLGRTEITPAIKSILHEGIRAFGDSSRIRSYFADPIRFIRGLENRGITDANGNIVTNWSQLSNMIPNLPYNETAKAFPQLEQLSTEDPNTLLESVNRLGKMVAREIGVAPSQLGYDAGANPSSAEAMNEADKGLILKAQTRMPQYSKAYKQMARFALKLKGIEVPQEELDSLDTVFKRPSTPTPASFADWMAKLNAVGLFQEELPSFVYRGMELNSIEILELKEWLAKKNNGGA